MCVIWRCYCIFCHFSAICGGFSKPPKWIRQKSNGNPTEVIQDSVEPIEIPGSNELLLSSRPPSPGPFTAGDGWKLLAFYRQRALLGSLKVTTQVGKHVFFYWWGWVVQVSQDVAICITVLEHCCEMLYIDYLLYIVSTWYVTIWYDDMNGYSQIFDPLLIILTHLQHTTLK